MSKLEQAKEFVYTLLQQIPNKTLNNKHMHIIKGAKDYGTLQEYINKNLKEIWGIEIICED
jgi:hypothetical protein